MVNFKQLGAKIKRAGVRLKPPAPGSEVEQFEATAGIALPSDYREFIIRIGDGGRHPCRLQRLRQWPGAYWIDSPDLSRHLIEPCIISPDAVKYEERWLDVLGPKDWQARFDSEDWDPVCGTIAVAEVGCGLFYSLIVNGPYRGRVFLYGDNTANPPKFVPEACFTEWIHAGLELILSGSPVYFLDGQIQG